MVFFKIEINLVVNKNEGKEYKNDRRNNSYCNTTFVFPCTWYKFTELPYFFNFKLFIHLLVPQVYRRTSYFICTPLFFYVAPNSTKKLVYKQCKNQRGDPWMEKQVFFHTEVHSQIFLLCKRYLFNRGRGEILCTNKIVRVSIYLRNTYVYTKPEIEKIIFVPPPYHLL